MTSRTYIYKCIPLFVFTHYIILHRLTIYSTTDYTCYHYHKQSIFHPIMGYALVLWNPYLKVQKNINNLKTIDIIKIYYAQVERAKKDPT